jgi:flagellar biogenesis protein FliO
MKKIILIILVSLSPVIGQTVQSELNNKETKSHFLSDSSKLTFTDSLRNSVPKKQAQSEVSGYLYKVVWITFVLLIFLVVGLYLYKKFILKNDKPFNSIIKIIAQQNLSGKQSIVIVNIEGKKYALGATDQQINLIAELGEITENDLKLSETQPIGFGQILKKITTKE